MSTDESSGQRLFTLAEANAIVGRIAPLLEQLRDEYAALQQARHSFGQYAATLQNHGFLVEGHRLESEIGDRIKRMRAGIEEITGLGIELKNIEWGLIDFPALRHGEVVYLCWRLDDGPLAYWHPLDAGFAGRRPIDDGFV